MMSRLVAAIILSAGACASAQELMVVTCSWTEMVAGTNTPVLAPNGILEPGEGALIQFSMYATRNGTNAVGQVITFSGGGHTLTGPIRGIGAFVYDVVGDGADATGTWNNRMIAPMFNWFPALGQIVEGGARVYAINSAQIAHGCAVINPMNPIPVVWRGVWNPTNYDPRVVHFRAESSDNAPFGQQNTIYVETGIDPASGCPINWARYLPTDFGTGIDIPIGGPGAVSFCYPNCDGSLGGQHLNVNDFVCFFNLFAAGSSTANCDGSTRSPILTTNDFMCYLNKYAASCP